MKSKLGGGILLKGVGGGVSRKEVLSEPRRLETIVRGEKPGEKKSPVEQSPRKVMFEDLAEVR
jgi:hypothetical protein